MNQAKLQALLHYDPRSGIFTRQVTTGNASKKGDTITGPAVIEGKSYLPQRLAFIYMEGKAPTFVKFLDGDNKNFRWGNLAAKTK
tara:strand:- start:223 stop:477 length:255 start_codon:yes stop_codon:yes gene_type:complete